MSVVFAPMSPVERERFQRAYLQYLHGRDGVPDLETHRFDVRERLFAELDRDPVRWQGAPLVDQQVFDRSHARKTPEPGLNQATLWALATAKANRGERYGVEYAVKHGKRPRQPSADPHTYIAIEEFYHTRILKDALATLGVQMEVGKPSVGTRVLVRLMVRLPAEVADVVVLCGEIIGVALFQLLLEKARTLFAAQPIVLARIESLFGQIMVDEVGHVHFVRSRLSPRRLAWARRILPMVAYGIFDDLSELEPLFGRSLLLERVLAADVDAAAAPYPDRFVLQR